MGARTTGQQRPAKPAPPPQPRSRTSALDHAVRVIYRVCCLAGSTRLVDDTRAGLKAEGVRAAIRKRKTAPVFDWLIATLSYQGIGNAIASDYMQRHGRVTWRAIKRKLRHGATCPKLSSYWQFYDCGYSKLRRTCAEPAHIGRCPLPSHDLRNGRLNQTAYALYLFIRDLADGDLIGWIDERLQEADTPADADRLARLRAAVIDPLRQVHGVSDKVLTMALSCLLLGDPHKRRRWVETGASMIAVDTLVHNFLHRTGILRRFGAGHAYGAACYRPGGCADIIAAVADRIDARAFNPAFPAVFPRFVQHAIWRYCAQEGFNVCNGNRIDDRKSCDNAYCQIHNICDRIALYK